VELKTRGLTLVDEVRAGDSYISHSDWRLHFGLGAATVADEIKLRWPSGKTETLSKVAANRVLKIIEK
jgi:hypothetical protein